MPLLPLSEGLGAQAGVFQEGTDDCQLGLFGLRVGGKAAPGSYHIDSLHISFFFKSSVCANLQGAAEGSDPVQPVVEQRVPGSVGETASKLLPATGSWVA